MPQPNQMRGAGVQRHVADARSYQRTRDWGCSSEGPSLDSALPNPRPPLLRITVSPTRNLEGRRSVPSRRNPAQETNRDHRRARLNWPGRSVCVPDHRGRGRQARTDLQPPCSTDGRSLPAPTRKGFHVHVECRRQADQEEAPRTPRRSSRRPISAPVRARPRRLPAERQPIRERNDAAYRLPDHALHEGEYLPRLAALREGTDAPIALATRPEGDRARSSERPAGPSACGSFSSGLPAGATNPNHPGREFRFRPPPGAHARADASTAAAPRPPSAFRRTRRGGHAPCSSPNRTRRARPARIESGARRCCASSPSRRSC